MAMKFIFHGSFCVLAFLAVSTNAKPNGPVNSTEDSCDDHKCGHYEACVLSDGKPICVCEQGFAWNSKSRACTPECTIHNGCSETEACIYGKCVDPCEDLCGINANCDVIGHIPSCSCAPGFSGHPFIICEAECTINSECPSSRSCINNRCSDPCPGACGKGATCRVKSHVAICECLPGYTGDPFAFCSRMRERPCNNHTCGSDERCAISAGNPVCIRVECQSNPDCSNDKACVKYKCVDPCSGSCSNGVECHVIDHAANCTCPTGTLLNPFLGSCLPINPNQDESEYCLAGSCGSAHCWSSPGFVHCACDPGFTYNHPSRSCEPVCKVDNIGCPEGFVCVEDSKCQKKEEVINH